MRTDQQAHEDELRADLRDAFRGILVCALQPRLRRSPDEFAALEFPEHYRPDDAEWADLTVNVWEWLTDPRCPVVVTRQEFGRKWPHVYRVFLAPAD